MTPAALTALLSGDTKNFIAAATPGGIEAQEKEGQIEQSFLETLPKDIGELRPLFEQAGFVFGGDYDDLFFKVTFPKGWRKSPTDHSMWTNLLDDKGRIRGSIFYKAAFYDRKAHAHLNRRFNVVKDYDGDKAYHVKDADGGKFVFSATAVPEPNWDDRAAAEQLCRQEDAERQKCFDWMKAQYPDSNNPLAYW